ncbi:LbtU family siderophore porin [Thiolapillus sp.]|uniref:LbtU family siderophore porin n=4 Tax=Thiolapillus sp. TaxID=2017437 RepID=UPI0025F4D852|nr:LbtU family siderophore porin [Thiolapillus sp.]
MIKPCRLFPLLLSATTLLLPFVTAVADEAALKEEDYNLKHRVERLEKSRIPLHEELAAEDEETEKKDAESQAAPSWLDRFHISALIEIEAAYWGTREESETDLSLSTLELGIDYSLNDLFSAHILALYEEDGANPPQIDEALITLHNLEESPWSLAAGRMVLTFGNYESGMITDPLTLYLGETHATAMQAGYLSGTFQATVFLGQPRTGNARDGRHPLYGFNLNLADDTHQEYPAHNIGLSWTSNLTDSDGLVDAIREASGLHGAVPGLGMNISIGSGDLLLVAEYMGATKRFHPKDLAFREKGALPGASNLEVDCLFHLAGKKAHLAMAWQYTREALAMVLPENRYLAMLAMDIHEHTTLSLEYAHDRDYPEKDGGTGDASNVLTLQLAASF